MREIGTVKYVSHVLFAYKKTKNDHKIEDRFYKKDHSQLHIREFVDKKTASNEARL
jgi:hypothetical protein